MAEETSFLRDANCAKRGLIVLILAASLDFRTKHGALKYGQAHLGHDSIAMLHEQPTLLPQGVVGIDRARGAKKEGVAHGRMVAWSHGRMVATCPSRAFT
ncbi:hypothetical protein ABIA45_001211 [Bradyrhizobium sp. USDA 336]